MVQRNDYFAYQEYALIAMLGDDNARNVGEAKMLARWKQVAEESANNDDCPFALNSSLIHLFDVPTLNLLEANAYYELANLVLTSKNLPQLQALQIQK